MRPPVIDGVASLLVNAHTMAGVTPVGGFPPDDYLWLYAPLRTAYSARKYAIPTVPSPALQDVDTQAFCIIICASGI